MFHHKNIILYSLFCLFFTFLSCTPFAPTQRSSPEGELPETFSLYKTSGKRMDHWWKELGDLELNMLVEESLSENFGIKVAWARLRAAQASSVIAGANRFPDLTLYAGAARSRQQIKAGSTTPESIQTMSDYSLDFITNYEIDIWGRIRSEQEAVILEESATREDVNSVAMTLVASVAKDWINIISQRVQKRLLEKQLKTNRIYQELIELRFHKGLVSALDVYQQKQIVEEIQANIPLIEMREQLLMHNLSLLLGKLPDSPIEISRAFLPILNDIPKTGLPADLLASRPDIRAAGLRLKAAEWQVSAARANRLPAIRLTGTGSLGTNKMDLILENWLIRLAANLTAPIFDGKKRAAEVDRVRAIEDVNLWNYRIAVVNAIREVEDILVSEKKQREHIDKLKLQIDAARKALEQASERYRRGLNDYLPVLTQLLSVQRLERNLIQQNTILVIYRINLFRALGGSWTNDLTMGPV